MGCSDVPQVPVRCGTNYIVCTTCTYYVLRTAYVCNLSPLIPARESSIILSHISCMYNQKMLSVPSSYWRELVISYAIAKVP
jgi:hypothetical protein